MKDKIYEEKGYQYYIKDDSAAITRYEGCDRLLIIPSTLGGLPVKRIENLANGKPEWDENLRKVCINIINNLVVEEIVLPDTVEEIGSGGFCALRNLRKITFPVSVRSVGDYTFMDCKRLETVSLNCEMTYIPECMFLKCTSLSHVTFPPICETIESEAFQYCENLEKVNLPESLISIKSRAFAHSGLKEFHFPGNVKRAEFEVLANCKNLTEIMLSDNMTEVAHYAFSGCSSLVEIHLPASLLFLGDVPAPYRPGTCRPSPCECEAEVFSDCRNLRRVTVASNHPNLTDIDGVLFSKDGKTLCYYPPNRPDQEYFVPDGVEKIQANAFTKSRFLHFIHLPEGLKRIGYSAFDECDNLEHISLPDSLEEIWARAFQNCQKLQNIKLPGSLKFLGEAAFVMCHSIEEISLPSSLEPHSIVIFSTCTV